MDTDKSGTITFEELKTGLSRLGSKLTEVEIKQLMEAVCHWEAIQSNYPLISLQFTYYEQNNPFITFIIFCQADVDRSGTIDYNEFIAATMHRHKLEKDENLYKAFQYFDKDDSGLVSYAVSLDILKRAELLSVKII